MRSWFLLHVNAQKKKNVEIFIKKSFIQSILCANSSLENVAMTYAHVCKHTYVYIIFENSICTHLIGEITWNLMLEIFVGIK